MRNTFIQISYLAASVCFILGLKSLTKPENARRGVKLAAMGLRIDEVTVSLDWGRRLGKSKMPVGQTMLGYGRVLMRGRLAQEAGRA